MPKIKIKIICSDCGSEDVRRDAFAEWDVETQKWTLGPVFDQGFCDNCGQEVILAEIPIT